MHVAAALCALLAWGEAAVVGRAGVRQQPASLPVASLKADLTRALEREASQVPNDCTRGTFLLAVVRHGGNEERGRVLEALRGSLAKALEGGQPECLVTTAAGLVPYLGARERSEMADRIVRLFETGNAGGVSTKEQMGAIAGLLDAGQAGRLAIVARRPNTHCYTRASLLAYLAQSGHIPIADALAATRACRDQGFAIHDSAIVPLLPLVDAAAKDDLLREALQALAASPQSFGARQLHSMVAVVPHIDAGRRHVFLERVFRAMPAMDAGSREQWGELAPEFHFWFVLTGVGPYVTTDLVPAALTSLPRGWPAETRAHLIGELAAALAPAVRRAQLGAILAAIPGPKRSLGALRARLMIASDLPAGEVEDSLVEYLSLEGDASARIQMTFRVLPVLQSPVRGSVVARARREIEAQPSAYQRGREAMAALDQLAGLPAR
jgi:hypothetical protein